MNDAPGGRAWRAALEALRRPLSFLARKDFENIDRVRDLHGTLSAAARSAKALAPSDALAAAIDALAQTLPPDDLPTAERVGRLREAWLRLGALAEVGDVAVPTPPPAPPAPIAPVPAAPPKRSSRRPGLTTPVTYLEGVGPKLAELLGQRGLTTVGELLRFLPRRYESRGKRRMIDVREGEGATVEGEVLAVSERRARGRRTLEVALGDPTGVVRLCWFRVPGQKFAERFSRGSRWQAAGTVKVYRGQMQMVHPEVQPAQARAAPEAEALVPVYTELEGFRPAHFRRVMARALVAAPDIHDGLPDALRRHRGLPTLAESIAALHAPPHGASGAELDNHRSPWHRRLAYEELLVLELSVMERRALAEQDGAPVMRPDEPLGPLAAGLFPFRLTGAQTRVAQEICADLACGQPMHRLLQGDVGSGKTAVALLAAVVAARSGFQAAIMAPTELLAEQHARTALRVLPQARVRMALLTGSVSASERRRVLADLASGHINVVVGTHAVIQRDVTFGRLGLAIIDEQHRFGVMQRARLREMGHASVGLAPHMLIMTATPIPRTLALTVYGDLDVSVMDELPPGRKPVRTTVFRDKQRQQVYALVRQAVEQGRQAYVVFPLVSTSDKEGMEDVRAATEAAAELEAGWLRGLRVGVVHGQLSGDEKDRIMRAFAEGTVDVLVATTVIEVGIDVPNATVIVVEHAERFGLSQLHQLRGRVGRGEHASACYLVSAARPSDDAYRRLGVMEKTQDGFRIAEADLEIRGPGDFLGTRQSGLPMLQVADVVRDHDLLAMAREDAAAILTRDPQLSAPEHAELRALRQVWSEKVALAGVG